jgi:schlafen family protein
VSPEVSERSFEEAIELALLADGPDASVAGRTVARDASPTYGESPPGGYRKRRHEDYDSGLCLLPRDVVDFVLATQPKEWQKLTQYHGAVAVKEQFLKRLTALRAHRQAEELIKRGESKTLEFKSTLRWNLKEDQQDDKTATHATLKTIAAFLNTEGGDLLLGVADDGSVVGTGLDRLEDDDKFMRHLAQVVRNGLGDRASTCIDPTTQIVDGKTVCLVSCQRSPEPVFLKWKGMETSPGGDFFVRSGPGTVKLPVDSASEYIRTRFQAFGPAQT